MDKHTKARIEVLHPSVRCEVTNIINECEKALTGRAKVRVTQGLRTDAEQTTLYAQGRTTPGKIVTNAKAGQSIHNYGFAVDICLIIDGVTASWDTKTDWDGDKKADWMEIVEIFKKHGWEWGGDWNTFKDMPHFEKKGFGDYKKFQKLKKDKEGYVLLALMVMLIFSLWSCGARKSSTSKTEEKQNTEVAAESSLDIKNDITEKKDVVSENKTVTENECEEENEALEPIDPTKPMSTSVVKDGNTTTKTYTNAKVINNKKNAKSKAEQNSKVIDKSTLTDKSALNKNDNSSSKSSAIKSAEAKKTVRGFNWLWLLLLIPIAGIIWFIHKKYAPFSRLFKKKT